MIDKKIIVFFFLILSLAISLLFVGSENLWFSSTNWLFGSGDLTNAQLGWSFFNMINGDFQLVKIRNTD